MTAQFSPLLSCIPQMQATPCCEEAEIEYQRQPGNSGIYQTQADEEAVDDAQQNEQPRHPHMPYSAPAPCPVLDEPVMLHPSENKRNQHQDRYYRAEYRVSQKPKLRQKPWSASLQSDLMKLEIYLSRFLWQLTQPHSTAEPHKQDDGAEGLPPAMDGHGMRGAEQS